MCETRKDALLGAIYNGEVVAVVGSGISSAVTGGIPLATWKGLLGHGIQRCKEFGAPRPWPEWSSAMETLLKSQQVLDLLTVAQQVEARLGGTDGPEFRRWIRGAMASFATVDVSTLEALRDLGIPIATTNYDDLIEKVTGLDPLTWSDVPRVMEFLQGKAKGVLHLHGYWQQPNTIVLGVKSYEELINNETAQEIQKALTAIKSLLFIGIGNSIEDPNIDGLLQWVKKVLRKAPQRHYRLKLKSEDISDQEPIFTVEYGENFSDLTGFLRSLVPMDKDPSPYILQTTDQIRLPLQRFPIVREAELAELVRWICDDDPPPTAVLGPSGIGKTTLCIASLHAPEVRNKYQGRRFFVDLANVDTADAMLAEIAREMALPLSKNLLARIEKKLDEAPAAIVLDSLETPWERDPSKTEHVLEHLNRLSGVAVIATVATRRPSGLRWRNQVILSELDSRRREKYLNHVTGDRFRDDKKVRQLINHLPGIPGVIDIIASAAASGDDISDILNSMEQGHGGVEDRMVTLEKWLELALEARPLDANARRLLALMGRLPGGFLDDWFRELLGDENGRWSSGTTLEYRGLATREAKRLRLPTAIGRYVWKHVDPEPADLNKAIEFFISLANCGYAVGRSGGGDAAQRIEADATNIESMLEEGLRRRDDIPPSPVIKAAIAYGRFQRFEGVGTLRLLKLAQTAAHDVGEELLEGECHRSLADITRMRSDHVGAQKNYEKALNVYRKGTKRCDNNYYWFRLGEADCHRGIADAARVNGIYEQAMKEYEEAITIYNDLPDNLGEKFGSLRNVGMANAYARMADIHRDLSSYAKAEKDYEKALESYEGTNEDIGKANCIKGQADLEARNPNKFTMSYKKYQQAEDLYCRAGYPLGVANCTFSVGDLRRSHTDYASAERQYEEALLLYRQVGSLHGEANCYQRLGDCYQRLGDLERKVNEPKAHGQYKRAIDQYKRGIDLYREVNANTQQAKCLVKSGGAAIKVSQYADALSGFQEARLLFCDRTDDLGEAWCHHGIGKVAELRGGKLEQTKNYHEAKHLYNKAIGQLDVAESDGKDWNALGRAYMGIADLSEEAGARHQYVEKAKNAWDMISRKDLIQQYCEDRKA